MLDDGVPVRHKKEDYEGIIDGQTSMVEYFTGNKEVSFQYRVLLPNSNIPRIAPEEDLEPIDLVKFKRSNPTSEVQDGSIKFKSKSFLMEAGYSLELNANARRSILT